MFIEFKNIGEFRAWNAVKSRDLGLPRRRTLNYTKAIIHPTNGKVCCSIEAHYYSADLTVISYKEMIKAGYFPGNFYEINGIEPE